MEDCFSRAHQCAGGAISRHDRHRLPGTRGGNRIRCLCFGRYLLHRGVYAYLGFLLWRTNLDGASQWRAELPRHWCGVLSQSSVPQRHFHSNSDYHQLSGPYLLSRVISNPQVYEAAWTYLGWRMWGIYFSMVACLFRAFFVATTQTGTLKFNSIVMVLSNVVFDYLLIFGHFGFPKLGIAGAAIASSMASGFSMLFFIGYTWWKVDYHKFALHRLPKFKWRLLGKMLNISIWTMVQNFLSLTTWFVFFIAVEHLGSRELAATNVMRAISNFMFVTLVAFASTASTLTSNLLGADHREAVVPMIKRATLMAVVSIVPLWMLLWIFPVPIVGIFTNEAPTIAACIEPLRVLSVSSTLLVPGFILFSCISGSGNTRSALVIELIALFFYVGFISYVVFYLRCSLTVAWCAELFYSLILLLGSFLYMRRGTWLNKKI